MTESIRQFRFIRGDENRKLGDGMEETEDTRPQYKGMGWKKQDTRPYYLGMKWRA